MIDWLKNLPWVQIIDSGEKLFKIIAILVGAFWAYYKFFKGRTFKRRLEIDLNANLVPIADRNYLKITASLKNVGLSKIPFDLAGSGLRIFLPKTNNFPNFVDSVSWKRAATLSAFERHQWIEPNEKISDNWLVVLPDSKNVIFKLELCIASKKTVWYATSIVEKNSTPLIGR